MKFEPAPYVKDDKVQLISHRAVKMTAMQALPVALDGLKTRELSYNW